MMANVNDNKMKPHLHQDYIDPHALGIVKALQKSGYTSYLVGGCVRDLLLGIAPKDFDIGTTASPEQIKRVIYRSFIIGKRFQLVLVRRDSQQFEVATFRKEAPSAVIDETTEAVEGDPQPMGDNLFGTPEEDARRRDFTINGLFYDPVASKLIDYAEGLPDLNARVIRMIGDPEKRLLEDPIRILRALRFSHKIGFTLEPDLRSAMKTYASSLPSTVLPRRREEFLKLLRLPDPSLAFVEAFDLGILEHAASGLHKLFENPEAQESFVQKLRRFHDKAILLDDTADLFGLFMHGFIRVAISDDPERPLRGRELMADEGLLRLMRDELGMFKSEQTLLMSALQIENLLLRRRDFEKRGARRQEALLRNEAFALALQFAERDMLLSPSDLLFWQERFREFAQKRELSRGRHEGSHSGSRGRRRRRFRKRAPRATAPASETP